jgi:sodium/potassium-transporting ATPase subunit alpha
MFYQGLRNQFMIFAFSTEILITLLLAYSAGVNLVFGTRDCIFIHFGLQGLPYCIFMNIWDEIRKYLIRNAPRVSVNKPSWWERNTFY